MSRWRLLKQEIAPLKEHGENTLSSLIIGAKQTLLKQNNEQSISRGVASIPDYDCINTQSRSGTGQ